jgi:hypothetical protein
VSRRVSLPGADELFRTTSESHKAETPRPETPAEPQGTQARGAEEPAGGEDQATQRPTRLRPALAPAPPPPAEADEPDAGAHRPTERADPRPRRTASGRVRHDEKMTVYVTADELMEIEQARLVLRRAVGSAVDRGRLVRAAVAMALADLDENGADGELVRRLSDT